MSGKGEKNDDSGSEAGDEGNSNVVVENAWAMKLPDFGPEGIFSVHQAFFSPILRQQPQQIFRKLEFRREILEFRKIFLSLDKKI